MFFQRKLLSFRWSRIRNSKFQIFLNKVEELVRKWSPKIWLAPNEQFYPLSVTEFLEHVTIVKQNGSTKPQSLYLKTKKDMEDLLGNRSSFLYGRDPNNETVPLYAVIEICDFRKKLQFHVTYWFFYPFSEGKRICTLNLGPFPIPLLFNRCYGHWRTFGSHVGDWEHISIFFNPEPEQIYLATHDSGAYYHLNHTTNQFVYMKQESRTRRGLLLQKPKFPERIRRNADDGRPVLFSAKGSHGFWSEPGRHKFTRLARLYDLNGYGTPWNTWKGEFQYVFVDQIHTWPIWFRFLGRWGNPKSHCYFLSFFGLDICHFVDGPTGIPLKKSNFQCSN